MAWWLESQSNFGMHVWLCSWPVKIMQCNCWITLMFAPKISQPCTAAIKVAELLPILSFYTLWLAARVHSIEQNHQKQGIIYFIQQIFHMKIPGSLPHIDGPEMLSVLVHLLLWYFNQSCVRAIKLQCDINQRHILVAAFYSHYLASTVGLGSKGSS